MPLLPSRTKFRKVQKGRNRGNATRGNTIAFGDYGIQAMGRGKLTARQLEAARVALNRHLKRKAKIWIRVFPHKPVTKKPAETRQGKGKGGVEFWCVEVKPGMILFEVAGAPISATREGLRLADGKLPFPCRFVSRDEIAC